MSKNARGDVLIKNYELRIMNLLDMIYCTNTIRGISAKNHLLVEKNML